MTEKKPMITLMRGISGCGKSHWVSKNRPGIKTCSANDFFIDEDGAYKYDSDKLQAAHNHCMNEFLDTVLGDDREDIVVDNTNIFATDLAPYILVGLASDYEVEIINILCPTSLAFSRCRNGITEEHIHVLARRQKIEFLPKHWLPRVKDVLVIE